MAAVSTGALLYAEREARVWQRLWRAGLFSGVMQPILFLGAMGIGLGGLVDDNTGTVGGVDYLSFIAPGLLCSGALQHASGQSLWPLMSSAKWTRQFHGAVATPLWPGDVYVGYLLWMGLHMAMNAVPFLVVAALLGGVSSAWGVLAIPAAVLGGLAFAAPLCAYVMTQDQESSFPVIMRIIVLPLTLFSGTFFPLDNLPSAVQPVAWVTPLWHAVELGRGATTGSLDLLPAVGHLAFLLLCIAGGVAWGLRTFTQRLTP